jgi:hypothetical protein
LINLFILINREYLQYKEYLAETKKTLNQNCVILNFSPERFMEELDETRDNGSGEEGQGKLKAEKLHTIH